MSHRTRLIALLALSAAAQLVHAQSAASQANEQRCQTLSQEVQASFAASVQARVPKQDPASFNQDNSDIKGIMSQDVTSGFSKLMNLNFGSIIQSIVGSTMTAATDRAKNNFSSKMNGVLSSVGIGSVNFAGITNSGGLTGVTNQISSNALSSVGNYAANGVNGAINSSVSGAVGSNSITAAAVQGAANGAKTVYGQQQQTLLQGVQSNVTAYTRP